MKNLWHCLWIALSLHILLMVHGEADDLVDEHRSTDSKSDEPVESEGKFVPSSVWQKVKKGQPLPRGVHVRLNINTGETEAKLLDQDENQSVNGNIRTELSVPPGNREDSDVPYMTKKELKDFLAKTIFSEEDKNDQPQDENEIKRKYKSYEELKKEFSDINLAVKTEIELLSELVSSAEKRLKHSDEPQSIVSVLGDLEYLVHQIDNAQEFIRLGGLTNVILPALNSSVANVRSQALWLLGSASQSNPKVQIAVLSSGIIHQLLKAAALDSDKAVRARAIYSLSCLTRRFPSAQTKLVEEGGLATLGKLFDSEHLVDSKTRMKILTLINDLILERKDVEKEIYELTHLTEGDNTFSQVQTKIDKHHLGELKEKLRQYNSINLEKYLLEDGWCTRLPKILTELQQNEANADRSQRRNDFGSVISENVPYRPEHDDVEKVLNSILSMSHICEDHFQANPDLEYVLRQLLMWYEELSAREEIIGKQSVVPDDSGIGDFEYNKNKEHDFYYTSMANTLNFILKSLKRPESDFKRDEL